MPTDSRAQVIAVLAQGQALRANAYGRLRDLNEAYLMAHCVVTSALKRADTGARGVDLNEVMSYALDQRRDAPGKRACASLTP